MKTYFVAVLVVILVVFVFTGCATTRMSYPAVQQGTNSFPELKVSRYSSRIEKAMNVLELKSPRYLYYNLPDGYLSSKFEVPKVRVLAGIYAGTVEVWKTEKGYSANGEYSQFQYPDEFIKVLREADINKDKIITKKELDVLTFKIYQENAK